MFGNEGQQTTAKGSCSFREKVRTPKVPEKTCLDSGQCLRERDRREEKGQIEELRVEWLQLQALRVSGKEKNIISLRE